MQETYLPRIGGAEMHLYYLARNLACLGHDVKIITGTAAKEGENNGNSIPIKRYKMWSGRKDIFLFLVWFIRIIYHSTKYDIVHAHYSSFLAFMCVITSFFTRKRVIITLHGYGTLDTSAKRFWIFRMYRYISLKYASHIIATSQELADVAMRFTDRNKITVITNGVDTELFKPHPSCRFNNQSNNLRLGTLRRIVPKNGVHYAVDIVTYAQREIHCTLDIVGDGPLSHLINEKIKKHDLYDVVKTHGSLDFTKVKDILDQIDIVLFMSTAESTSLAALESMSKGCIVLCSNAGAFPDMITDGVNGFIVDIFEHGQSNYNAPLTLNDWQYRRVIDKLIHISRMSSEELNLISKNAREYVVEKYSWSSIVNKTVNTVYKD